MKKIHDQEDEDRKGCCSPGGCPCRRCHPGGCCRQARSSCAGEETCGQDHAHVNRCKDRCWLWQCPVHPRRRPGFELGKGPCDGLRCRQRVDCDHQRPPWHLLDSNCCSMTITIPCRLRQRLFSGAGRQHCDQSQRSSQSLRGLSFLATDAEAPGSHARIAEVGCRHDAAAGLQHARMVSAGKSRPSILEPARRANCPPSSSAGTPARRVTNQGPRLEFASRAPRGPSGVIPMSCPARSFAINATTASRPRLWLEPRTVRMPTWGKKASTPSAVPACAERVNRPVAPGETPDESPRPGTAGCARE